ncbi:MAG TPA: response regulator [Pyrinomonadaceae bacterium]
MSTSPALAPAVETSPQPEAAFNPKVCTRRALVVDDNPDIADMLAVVLRHAGYEATAAYSPTDALSRALAEHYDVIISDIGMPGMTGYELARALREIPEYNAIPMIAVTGFAMYDDRERALEAGFNTHLSKPIDPLALTRALSGICH